MFVIYQLQLNAVVLETVSLHEETHLIIPLSNKGTHNASLCVALNDLVRPESESKMILITFYAKKWVFLIADLTENERNCLCHLAVQCFGN